MEESGTKYRRQEIRERAKFPKTAGHLWLAEGGARKGPKATGRNMMGKKGRKDIGAMDGFEAQNKAFVQRQPVGRSEEERSHMAREAREVNDFNRSVL